MEAVISAIQTEVITPELVEAPIQEKLEPAEDRLAGLVALESPARRWALLAMAWVVALGFFYCCWCFWVPANAGVDQNGYLFGGRRLAETGTMKFAPVDPATGQFDPHQFVGSMWVGADYTKPTERFYPKYPIGLPVLVAICLKIGGPVWGPWLTYWINPFAMTGAVLGTFFLLRTFCGSYLAVLGQIIFATSPVTMLLAIDANSHATAVFCVTIGMVGLIEWWKRGRPWVALAAGLLLGYAVTIRYSEATLAAVIGVVVLIRLGKFWKARWRDWLGGVLATVGWLIPVGALLAYNLYSLGSFTGYDPTNESKPGQAFTFEHFSDNWETLLRHLSTNGLFFTFPIAIVGLMWMFAWRRRVALVMAAWIIPCFACYTFYYWAPDGTNIGYLRFFTTILPALVLCAMWVIGHLTRLITWNSHSWLTRTTALAVAPVVVVLSTAVQLQASVRDLENLHYSRLMLKFNTDEVLAAAPAGSVILSTDNNLFHNLQFMRDYLLFDSGTYNERTNHDRLDNWKKSFETADPQGLDPGRVDSLDKRLKGFTQQQLDQQQRQMVVASLAAGRRVYVVEAPAGGKLGRTPRKPGNIVEKLTADPGGGAAKLFADVVRRWRVKVIPAPLTASRDDNPDRRQPRLQKTTLKTITYDQPWLVYEVTKVEPPMSIERQAILDYDKEQKTKADQVAADKAATEKAKQLAEKKRQDDLQAKREQERQKQVADQQKRDAAEKDAQAKLAATQASLAAAQAKLDQVMATRTTAEKAVADLKTKQTTAEGAIGDLTAKRTAAEDALKRATADQSAAQQAVAGLNDQRQKLAGAIEGEKKQLQDLQSQIAAAKAELQTPKPPATQPTTQP